MPKVFCALVLFSCLTTRGPLEAEELEYQRDVKSVLRERCYACHGALKQEGNLRLDTVALIMVGGDSGPALKARDAEGSYLLQRVMAEDEAERMPPEGKRLTARQIARLREWIASGAVGPADEQPEEAAERHWSFQPPQRAELPASGPTAAEHAIDALLAKQQQRLGLTPVPLADRRLLLRRLYLDLLGLPPTRAELEEFLDDERPDAYQRVVERLLESPQYGERWGRHWMDVWRYADWAGLGAQLRYSQKHIWHWRDWIVDSLNEDKGLDRMIVEMLAADEIAPDDPDTLRATGFLARNYYLFNRTTWLDNTVEHTSKAFLGLTINCSKCHDHKYDPISQEDYYRLRAVFEPHQVRLDPVPGEIDLEKDGLPRVFDAHPDAVTHLLVGGDEKKPDKSRVIEPGVPALLAGGPFHVQPVVLPVSAHRPGLQEFVLHDHLARADRDIGAARDSLAQARQALARHEAAIPATDATAAAEQAGALFLRDDFTAPQPAAWETGPGQWAYVEGVLRQSKIGPLRAYLQSRKTHPRDFEATVRFQTTGGDKWRSVGICFDAVDGREKLVYLSAVEGGSKLQISYKSANSHVYPHAGKQDRPVQLNTPYQMRLAVRGTLVNVSLDGRHALAFELPLSRESGRLQLIAFDAAVDFDEIEIRELPVTTQLIPAGGPTASPSNLADATAAVRLAEAELAVAERRPAALRTAHAADLAKLQKDQSQVEQLAASAALAHAEQQLAVAAAEVARAERQLATADEKSTAKAEQQLKTAKAKYAAAEKVKQQPNGRYESLRVSKKALEGPAETAESQGAAFPPISTGRRTALARWITDRKNPLTARVAVNHVWTRHFGQPLVPTVDDFGRRAHRPPLQPLLDWLAIDFMEHDWSMKHLHRRIVMSRTYRLASLAGEPHNRELDPENAYYWRRLPARMEAQLVRDSLLHLAGDLDLRLGGPDVNPQQEKPPYRRSLYFTHSRDTRQSFLAMFDDADVLACYRRSQSIVPQQALTLANSKLSLTTARKIADRLSEQLTEADDESYITAAFQWILASRPNAEEIGACRQALEATRALLSEQKHANVEQRARHNLVHALLNHNDFITVH